MDLTDLTIAEARAGLDAGDFSAVDLTQAALAKISERNQSLNAVLTVCEDSAIENAKNADAKIAAGEVKFLTGIPFTVKDAICTASVRSTASAKILDNYVPPYSATVVQKVLDTGAVLIGKTNCDAFGHGASNENSMYGPVKNPFDESRVAGGSSGGSAAAVASGMGLFSIAEDTGGSVRFPAGLCGVVGLRPTYGRASRFGLMPMASSFDTPGPMAKTVADAAAVFQMMAGFDQNDLTSLPDAVPSYVEDLKLVDVKKLRIGLPAEYFSVDGMDTEIKNKMMDTIAKLKGAGVNFTEVSLPLTKYAMPVYYVLVPSEDSSNLGRMDAIRYGVQQAGAALENVYINSRTAGFPDEVKRRIMVGTYALSAGYFDAYYKKATAVRAKIKQEFAEVFTKVDLLLTPTSPYPAFKLGEKAQDPLAMYLADVFMSPAAVAGIPGLSVPIGFSQSGWPIGAQIIGPSLSETNLFAFGQFIEQL